MSNWRSKSRKQMVQVASSPRTRNHATRWLRRSSWKRVQVVKVCADPACRTHHPNTPSPQQVERERAEERKRIEKEKLAITARHGILARIPKHAAAHLKKSQ